jgi:hypothetical protein
MKKSLLLFFFILPFGFLHAQPGTDYPVYKSGIWIIRYAYGAEVGDLHESYTMYLSSGDTLIAGTAYNKLYDQSLSSPTAFVSSGHVAFHFDPLSPRQYIGAYRNDTLTKKTYLFLRDSTAETLWYDFDLEIGDTLPSMYSWWTGFSGCSFSDGLPVVSQIESWTEADGEHKVFMTHLTSGGSLPELEENLGFIGDLLHQNFPYFECGYSRFLYCSDTTTYNFCGNYISGTEPLKADIRSVVIYPNPADERLTIEISRSTPGDWLEIMDMTGHIVFRKNIESATLSPDLNKVIPGFYLVCIKTQNGALIHQQKLTVIR